MAKKNQITDPNIQIDSGEPGSGPDSLLIVLIGLGAALGGLALCAGPSTTPKLAEVAGKLSESGVFGSTLMMGGLILVVLGLLRRGQHAIGAEIWRAENDPKRAQVSNDVFDIREEVAALNQSQGELSRQAKENQAALHALLQGEGPSAQVAAQVQALSQHIEHAMLNQAAGFEGLIANLEKSLTNSVGAQLEAKWQAVHTEPQPAPEAVQAEEQLALESPPELATAGYDPLGALPAEAPSAPDLGGSGVSEEIDAALDILGTTDEPSVKAVTESLAELAKLPASELAPPELAMSEPTDAGPQDQAVSEPAIPELRTADLGIADPSAEADEPMMIDLDDGLSPALPAETTEVDPLANLGNMTGDDEVNITDESLRLALKRLSQDAG